ncbi:YadA-like family protein [Megasphaera elsdenii]|uniref:YadA-like family protein n=1 Tax=Megasphaera elsdenii TaxID=907 RepID=UPI003520073C
MTDKECEELGQGKQLASGVQMDGQVFDNFATAIGDKATADAPQTISFGHDKGDVSGYKIIWKERADGERNPDGTIIDYNDFDIQETYYDSAYYNRLVKAADGIEDHDAVVMEQLKNASGVGSNVKVYKIDENGNVQFDAENTPIEDPSKEAAAQQASKTAWGQALGADAFSKGTTTTATNASTSDQLVTGKTLYNYDAPVAETGKKLNYVSANNTTGQNLSALDAQVADNASKLNDKTHNIKYYSVNDKKSSTQETLPTVKDLLADNSDNKGAKGMGSLASGFSTEADGIASTVAGSYSGVINTGDVKLMGYDFRGATALSYGTFNINQSTAQSGVFSGVANSIVGQANMTTNSNAAIIYGAGNTVTNSYRLIDPTKAGAILDNVSDPAKLGEALQAAVKDSGGQVMVMGGGNNVESAYMSQVVGVGNTVKGNQVEKTKGEWVTDTSDTAIKDYNSEKSSQYNYVDGFNNEVINGKHDYVIGANNKLSGDSYDDDKVLPIKRSNKSNIVIGDNHTLTREKNTVIIGSSDTENTQTENTQTKANDAVIIGHNANATSDTGADNAVAIGRAAKATGGNAVTIGVNTSAGDNSITIGSESHAISGSNIAIGRYARVYGDKVTKAVALGQKAEAHVADGVAIGSGSIATVAGNSVEGYDPTTGQDSTDGTATWKATNAAVSIGTADGKVTRQINGVAAGTNDTDAVNVAQLKKLEGMKANVDASNVGSNIKVYKTGDDKTPVLDDEATKQKQTENENAWGAAIGTGKVAKDNGQLVTGKTVYDALHGGLDDVVFGHDGKDGKDGSIGLVGPKGQDGKDGKTTTIIKTETGAPGVNGEDGKDGITRIVYNDKDNPTDKHTVATLDDGMKYAGDTGDAANVALNHQLKLSGTTFGEDKVHKSYDEKDWTSDNIAVVSDKVDKDGNAVMNLKLSKDLKDLNSSTYTTTETTGEGDQKQTTDYTTTIDSNGVTIQSKVTKDDKTEVVNGPSMTIDGINGGGKQITNVGDGFKKNADGSYTISETDKKNAANIGDVQTIVDKATKDLTEGTNGLNNKANIDASNIGSNIKVYKTGDDKTPVLDDEATKQKQTENENAWGAAIGTGEVAKDNGQLVTGKTVYDALHGGLDDVVFGHDGKDGKDGSIGLVGPKGQDGKDGKTTTIIKTETGAPGVNGEDGKDGITRIVYNDKDNPTDKHTVATLDDGMKYAGDTGDAANVALNHQLKLSGTTFGEDKVHKSYDEKDWTSDNIAVVSDKVDKDGNAVMNLKLSKDLKDLNSSTYTTTETTGEGDQKQTTDYTTTIDSNGVTIQSKVTKDDKTEVVNGPSMTIDGINGGGKQITNVGDGFKKNADGSYTISETDKKNAANIGDVQTIVDKATKDLTEGTNGLNNKANVDASNIGSNIKVYKTGDDKTPVLDDEATKQKQTENENAWGAAIGTGEVAKDNGQLVTGKTVYDALHGGLDDVVFGHDGKDGKDGSIGLVGPKGQDGKDGKTTTIIKTETGAPGVNGEDGKDGITRIVYNDKDNPTDKHTVATLDDGMKYAGDTGDAANVALNHQLKLSGTTFGEDKVHKSYDEKDWTSDNIAVVSDKVDKDGNAVMNLKLSKDLKDLNSSTYTTTETTGEGDQKKTTTYTTIINGKGLTIQSGEQGSTTSTSGPSITIDGIDGGGKAITNISSGIEKDDKGNYTDKSKLSAANINDVQTIVNDAKKDLTDGKNGLNNKANVDASNIGENLKDADGRAASTDAVKTNKDAWASAIGTNEVKEGNKQLVTSDAVAKELANKADKSYVDQELGKKADKTYVDEKLNTKADKSEVYTKNETYSKSEVDNKVTNITKGLDDKANKDLGNITDAGKQVIKDLAKGAVKVIAGTNTTVAPGTDKDGATTYAVNVEGNGKVASGNTGLISGGTLYNEVHVTTDGSYIKSNNTVGQNLSALDSGLKTTSDLIHTNTKGDTIQIGGNSTATKIDVNGKDGKGRVITGVVSDANDPNSAANVGYVNGLTAANTQQIYRDMNNAYSRLDTNINRAAAGSNALAALHPLDFDPADKASFAVGYGHYRNANAAAVGAFYQPNANTMVNMGVSLGNGDPGFNAGVSFKIGKGSAYNGVSKAEMAQTIHDQATEISAIKADDAAKDKRIDALEKENQEMKKQIQEILARLNG